MKNNTDYNGMTVGLDVGDRRTRYAVLDSEGKVCEEDQFKTDRQATLEFAKRCRGARVILEVGAHSRWMSQIFEAESDEVYVANARQLRLIYASVDKDDRLDAMRLAKLGRFDIELLKPIQHRSDESQADLEVLKARALLVRMRASVVNHIRGVLKSFGMKPPKCTTRTFSKKLREMVPENLSFPIGALLDQLDDLTARINGLERKLEVVSREKYGQQTELVRQVNGIGLLSGLTYVLTISDPSRFKKSRDVGSYLGLRPKRHESGDKKPDLRTTRTGDRFLRTYLVQSANYILGPFGTDCALRRWGLSKAAGGKSNRKRAVIAVARKLSVLLHRLIVTGEVYDPMRNCDLSLPAVA
jgi:transposase